MNQKEYNQSVSKYADDVYRFAMHCCGSKEQAEDAVQESYEAMWKRRSDVKPEKARQFLFAVVNNYLMSSFRHEAVARQAATDLQTAAAVAPDEGFDLQEALAYAMAQLPQVQRAAIHLKDVEGYICAEIGQMLDLTENQVAVYLFRARVSMKKTLISLGYEYHS